MMTTTIGKNAQETPDPDALNRKKPSTLFKDETHSYFVQGDKIFSLNGSLLISKESSKNEIWDVQQSDVGRDAVKAAGIEVTLADAEQEKTGGAVFPCEICQKSFVSDISLVRHMKLHSPPKHTR